MPATLWNGTISFGLVAIPVSMVPAVRESRVAFHLLHDEDNARLARQMRCTVDDASVTADHMVRGTEVDGRYVVVTDEELEGIAPERSRTLEIEEFVSLDAIPALYLNRPYYLLPAGAEKPYRLLVETLAKRQRMGITRFVLHTREHLAGIRAFGDLLCLLLLHFQEMILPAADLAPEGVQPEKVDQQKIDRLIAELSGPFHPEQYTDPYRERVLAFLQERRQAKGTVSAPQVETEEGEEVVDLMQALEESMNKARERRRHAA